MPLQNRVTPCGHLASVATRYDPATAAFGNRGGPLHNKDRKITKAWHSKAWLACRLNVDRTRKVQRDDNRAFNGRKRIVMRPGSYTELFFLDQYVATAAGHRPCACCRRKDYTAFVQAWTRAHGKHQARQGWSAGLIDEVLHRERDASSPVEPHSPRLTALDETLCGLPDGAFVSLHYEGSREWQVQFSDAWLCWQGHLLKWSHDGYCDSILISAVDKITLDEITLLTPHSMVAAMRCGFVPGDVHSSADALLQREE
jgi:hypothetical protein